MKTTKRLLSLALVLVMLFGMFPAQANAATTGAEHDHSETTADVQPQATGAVRVEHNGETTYYADLQKAFDGFAPSNNTYGGKYVVTLLGNVTGKLSKSLQYPTEALDITLDLNGYTITGDGSARVVSLNVGSNNSDVASAKITLKDSSGTDAGTITGGKGGVYVYGANVVFNFESGTITGNHGAEKGGGILAGDKVYFRMTGGVITGNSVSGTSSANTGLGGGVCGVNMTITGGEISGNTAYGGSGNYTGRGGGVCTEIGGTKGYHSVVIGSGALISGNTAANAGDDLFIAKNLTHSANLYVSIPTENWYIDGMNGQNQTSALCARYDELDPVPYTDGGWEIGTKKAVGLKYFADPYDGPIYAITYTDGVEGEEIFADQTYKGRPDKTTPAFKGTPERIGYVFAGWSPEVPEYPSQDMTFVAQWVALPAYTVTYTDGVEGEEIFPDQVYDTYEGYETPAFQGTPAREHYIFTGWNPEVIDTVTATVVYAATWREAVVYTITYTDGAEGEEIFPDQIYQVEEQQATPTYKFEGKREDYKFSKWNPTVAKTVTGDATYTAVWTACSHSWGTGVFDEETLSTTYTCSYCGKVKVEYVAAEINGTYYATLQEALTSQARGTGNVTVKLLSDVTGDFSMTWTAQSKGLNLTIDLNGHTVTGSGAKSVFTFNRTGSTMTSYKWNIIIEDTSAGKTGTITGGKGNTNGGAITVSNVKLNDSLTINGGNFKNNTATNNGGAIYSGVTGYDVIINGGVFEGNTATASGGAIYGAYVVINGGTFTGNSANSTTYGGGAVYSSNTLTVSGGTFTGNTAVNGGAIYASASKPIVNITGGKIYDNTATGYGDDIVFKCSGSTAPTFNLMAAAGMEVEGISNWYVDGYYVAAKADRFSQTVKVYEKPSALTRTTLALKAASHYTVTYTDGVENEEIFADQVILVAPGSATPAFEGEIVREGYTFVEWTPAVAESVTGDVTYVATWKENARGGINGVTFRGDNEGLAVELEDLLAYESVQVKVYFGETLLTTVSWRDEYIQKGVFCEFLTASVRTGEEESTQWAATEWTAYVNQVPTKVELYVDGALMGELAVKLDAKQWAAQNGVRVPVMGEIVRAWLNPNNGRLMVDLENLGFEKSVVLELYSGETLLTSSSLNTAEFGSAIYAELTGNIGVQDYTASDTWPCQEWTAWNDTMPTAVKLVVDGQTVAVCENIQIRSEGNWIALSAENWTSFPGVRLRPQGDINGIAFRGDNEGLSIELHKVQANETIEVKVYSGETLLTTLSLRDIEENKQFLGNARGALTVSFRTYDESTSWAATEWAPADDVVPTKYELYIDGVLMDTHEQTVDVAKWNALKGTRAAMPALPENNGSNVTEELITVICDTDEGHTSRTYGWDDPAANIVFPKGSEPVWNEELNAWTIGVRMDSIETYYVNLRFSKEHNGIQHQIDGEGRIDTTLVWDEVAQKWQTLTGEAFEIHVGCQTAPEVPGIGYFLSNMKIKMIGTVDGAEKVWFESLHRETVIMGQVYGNRAEGFFVDATVVLDDSYVAAWVEKHAPGKTYGYAEDTAETVTFTLKYTGNITGELYDGPEYWAIDGDYYRTVNVEIVPPAAPNKYGDNVTPDLIQVICDSDPNHEPMNIDWQSQSTKVYPGAQVEWNEELNTWTIKVRIDSISVYYVWLNYVKSHNDILHPLVDEEQQCIDTYLKWDEEKQLWVTLDGEPIAVHVACQTAPTAPTSMPSSFQIQVKGDLDGDGIYGETKKDCALGVSELRAVTIPAGGYTLGEVYGSREEGFFVDVTVTLEDGDAFITTWMEHCAPEGDYIYNWNKTEKTVTFTLKYNRSTTGTLYGSNRSDWAANFSGYKVGEAYVIPAAPAAPKQDNVTDKLVAVLCDSDSERHETVYGKWYPQHCKTTSDMVWNEELGAWTVDIRIGSLYVMYVDQLEDANYGTTHELVEDITTVYSTLVWDAEQNLWVPVEAIELHTTCRTAPLAPEYKQLKSYQLKVKGDLDGDGVWGESKATNNGILEQYSTSLPENGYTISEVYGSREEGFFVDVTFTLENGDIYLTNWNEKCAPCYTYAYDWEQTEKTVTFTLKYNGSLNGTLYGNRHATNTNYDWVLVTNDSHFGVVAEAYVTMDPNGTTYHEYESTVEEPTCTEGGYTLHICSVCGAYYTDSETEALGHDLGDAYVVTEPTCTEAGESRQDCSRCDYFETAEIKALGHTYETKVVDPTCTEGGYTVHTCTVCDDTYVDALTPAQGHDLGDAYVVTEPTCTEAGESRQDCSRCDYFETAEIKALGHVMSDWTVTKEPTINAEGEKTRNCERCDYVETEAVAKLDKLATPAITKFENVTTGIKITWGKVDGAEKYRVYVKNGNSWKNLGNTTGTSFTWTGAVSGETYTFTVRCVAADSSYFTSDYNTTGWKHTFVAAPVITNMESTSNGVKITWNAVAGAENYRLFVKGTTGWQTLTHTSGTSYTWTGAEIGKTYIFTVRCTAANANTFTSAYNAAGWSFTYAPSAPEVTMLESTTSGVKITWGEVAGAEKYRVFLKTTTGWKTLANTADTSYTWTGAEAGETYIFTVRCIDEAGNFTSSFKASGWEHTYKPTPAITKLEAATSGVKLTWTAIKGTGKYRVYVQNANGGWTKIGETTGTSFTWTAAKTGTTYTFTVRCLNDAGEFVSDYNTAGWTCAFSPAPAVTKLESTGDGVKLTWTAINGAAKYRVFVKNANGGWTKVGETTGTTFTWTGAKTGETYTFTVRCLNASGAFNSNYDPEGWTCKYNPAPAVTKLESTANGIALTWDAINGAGKYRVFVKNANGGWTKVGDTTGTSFTWTAAKVGVTYTFTVRCMDAETGAYNSAYDLTGWTIEHK